MITFIVSALAGNSGSPSIASKVVGGKVTNTNKESSPHPPCDSQIRCHQEVYYNQCDSRWSSHMYSSKNNKAKTICNCGCGPSAMAMVVSTYANRAVTPVEMAEYSMKHGMVQDGAGTYWTFFCSAAKAYGLKCQQLDCRGNMQKIREAIDGGALGIASMSKGQWTQGGHFISVNSFDGNHIWAHDPNYRSGKKSSQLISQFEKECKQFWIIRK